MIIFIKNIVFTTQGVILLTEETGAVSSDESEKSSSNSSGSSTEGKATQQLFIRAKAKTNYAQVRLALSPGLH
jgi:hypothetical protein